LNTIFLYFIAFVLHTRRFRIVCKFRVVGTHRFYGTLSQPGLNRIKLAYHTTHVGLMHLTASALTNQTSMPALLVTGPTVMQNSWDFCEVLGAEIQNTT